MDSGRTTKEPKLWSSFSLRKECSSLVRKLEAADPEKAEVERFDLLFEEQQESHPRLAEESIQNHLVREADLLEFGERGREERERVAREKKEMGPSEVLETEGSESVVDRVVLRTKAALGRQHHL